MSPMDWCFGSLGKCDFFPRFPDEKGLPNPTVNLSSFAFQMLSLTIAKDEMDSTTRAMFACLHRCHMHCLPTPRKGALPFPNNHNHASRGKRLE